MSSEWQHGLCGCFDNCYVCVCVYFCPCIVIGKIAEKLGDSCCLHGAMVIICPMVSLFLRCTERGKIRQQRGIAGSEIGDCCIHYCIPWCGLCQEAQEVNAMDRAAMACEGDQDIQRE